ncbi:hypothetical protein CSPX01_12194 [Colletotrichum filicis]|nr:hypothetical protein CSPX01_12194 [Colletotrichum filicis]
MRPGLQATLRRTTSHRSLGILLTIILANTKPVTSFTLVYTGTSLDEPWFGLFRQSAWSKPSHYLRPSPRVFVASDPFVPR